MTAQSIWSEIKLEKNSKDFFNENTQFSAQKNA